MTWYSCNLPKRISRGSSYSDLSYTPARSRTPDLPVAPFGLIYHAIGTPIFLLAGALQ